MILSDADIISHMASGRIVIDPFDDRDLQPSSVDVHLAREYLWFPMRDSNAAFSIDPQDKSTCTTTAGGWSAYGTPLDPGLLVLASTLEHIEVPDDLVARIEGKSSLGRLGLSIHVTAGYVDPGWKGHLTLELTNVASRPILLRPGMKIGQISFQRMTTPASRPYGSEGLGSKYQHASGPEASRTHLEVMDASPQA